MIYWFWMMAGSFGALRGFARSFPGGSTLELMVTASISVWVVVFFYAKQYGPNEMAEPFISQLRSIAQDPLPQQNDPRFKEWKDVRKRFPAAAGGRIGPQEEAMEGKAIRATGAWFWRPVGRVTGLAWGKVRRAVLKRLNGHSHAGINR